MPREVLDPVQRLRPLLAGQAGGGEVLAHLVEGRRGARPRAAARRRPRARRAGRRARPTTLTSATAVQAEHQLLDLLGADVLAAADDDVGHAIGDGEVAVVVEHADVAGAVPAVVVEDGGGQLGVGVADEAVGTPAEDLAVVVEADLDAGQRASVGAEALVLGVVEDGNR